MITARPGVATEVATKPGGGQVPFPAAFSAGEIVSFCLQPAMNVAANKQTSTARTASFVLVFLVSGLLFLGGSCARRLSNRLRRVNWQFCQLTCH